MIEKRRKISKNKYDGESNLEKLVLKMARKRALFFIKEYKMLKASHVASLHEK
tara:strand:+ start:301 stop:459 length:159 start_codon:yes stop_codon:yes gene_type:complete